MLANSGIGRDRILGWPSRSGERSGLPDEAGSPRWLLWDFWGHCGGSTGPFKRPSFILAQPPAVGRMIRERNLGSFELV